MRMRMRWRVCVEMISACPASPPSCATICSAQIEKFEPGTMKGPLLGTCMRVSVARVNA